MFVKSFRSCQHPTLNLACHPVTGLCLCSAGYVGEKCDMPVRRRFQVSSTLVVNFLLSAMMELGESTARSSVRVLLFALRAVPWMEAARVRLDIEEASTSRKT